MWTVTVGLVKVNPQALRAIREKDGHTTYSLAELAGVSQTRISELENPTEKGPRRIWPSTAKAIAKALGVPLSAFAMSDDEDEEVVAP